MIAPFHYFGGKSTIAPIVWAAFGSKVYNYIEPFCGSAAVLLSRPDDCWPEGKIAIETINDFDGFVTNFWRAVTAEPDAVAKMMNYPVSECDLEARHKWLVRQTGKNDFIERMKNDPDYYDAKCAAWWCWGLCQWIGSGWCGGEWFGPNDENNHGQRTCNDAAKLPHLGRSTGVHKKLPHLGRSRGVHKQRPHLADAENGEFARRGEVLRDWMTQLANRLRGVRICCGDWLRVCKSPATTTKHGLTGIFLDPPYSAEAGRDNDLYRCEDLSVAHRVREYCLLHGDDPKFRICLAGYDGEHDELVDAGWRVVEWKASGGYANQSSAADSAGKSNAHRERLWFSPHCIGQTTKRGLFV